MQKFLLPLIVLMFSPSISFAMEPKKTEEDKRITQWSDTMKKNGFEPVTLEGYLFAVDIDKEILKGSRKDFDIKEYDKLSFKATNPKKIAENQRIAAGNYKIHLMPFDDDINQVLQKIFTLLKNNKELQKNIANLKVYKNYSKTLEQQKKKQSIFPRIVIYPSTGKENAQKVLDILYKEFKNYNGMNITPRYNAKVTSLIYVAQGGADFKNDPDLQQYYEQPNKIYYNIKEIPPVAPDKDHYLRHPQTGKPLVSIK